MLLAVDIGNSQTKFGVFDGPSLLSKLAIATDPGSTPAEMSDMIRQRLDLPFSRAVACSVVPKAAACLRDALRSEFGIETEFIDGTTSLGISTEYDPPASLGADRLVNALAAAEIYGSPCVVCSFGTATTIDAVDKGRKFLGGIIAPGMRAMAEALHLATARLPEVEIVKPARMLGTSTESSIRAGVFFGYSAMIEGLIKRIVAETGGSPRVIATGGFARMIADETDSIQTVNENLTLEGLRIAADRI